MEQNQNHDAQEQIAPAPTTKELITQGYNPDTYPAPIADSQEAAPSGTPGESDVTEATAPQARETQIATPEVATPNPATAAQELGHIATAADRAADSTRPPQEYVASGSGVIMTPDEIAAARRRDQDFAGRR